MRLASWLVATHHRPQYLGAALATLLESSVPAGWDMEIVVAHLPTDAAGARIAREAGAIAVVANGATPGEKRNAALKASGGELVLVADDDDLQSPRRLGLAIEAYASGWMMSGVREYRRLHWPSGEVVRWCGRGNHRGIGLELPPVAVGVAYNYQRGLLERVNGWRALPKLETTDMHTRIRKRSPKVKERDLGPDLALACLQHDQNIIGDRQIVANGERAVRGHYVLVGEGRFSEIPDFPHAAARRLAP